MIFLVEVRWSHSQFDGRTEMEEYVVFARSFEGYLSSNDREDHGDEREEEDDEYADFLLEVDLYVPK